MIGNANGAGAQATYLADNSITDGQIGAVAQMVWSPYPAAQTFVGSSGTLATTGVSGFLLTENGNQFASLLTFAAVNPGKATIVPPASTTPTGPTIYELNASDSSDSITNISYTNAYFGADVSIPLTATPTAVVSVDGSNGQVDFVAPAVSVRTVPAASRASGSPITYAGQFTAIYNEAGKNLAPFGATTLKIDRSTGKLISFQ
jgi:hypothetical protein